MSCRAWAKTKGRRCTGTAKTADGLCGYCDWRRRSGHDVVILGDDIQGAPLSPSPSLPEPSLPGGAEPPAPLPPRELQEIPEAPPVEMEPITIAAPAPAPPPLPPEDTEEDPAPADDDLSRLDSIASGFWGVIAADPDEAEAAAVADAVPVASIATAPNAIAGRWDPPRVERYLRIVNSWVERSGKEPLSPGEIKEGGVALAPICDDWFSRLDPANPYTVATLWLLMTFGTRYAADVVRGVRYLVARRRGGAAPAPAPAPDSDPAPAGAPDPDDELPPGWGVLT